MMAVVSVSLFFLYFLCLWSFYLGIISAEKLLCLLYKIILKVSYPIIILWISLEKGECFDFNHTLGYAYPTMYIIRLLCRVYRYSLLICYPSSYIMYIYIYIYIYIYVYIYIYYIYIYIYIHLLSVFSI